METATARSSEYNTKEAILHLAFELGESKWHLGFTTGLGQKVRRRTIAARDLIAIGQEIRLAKQRFGLPEEGPVKSCYEAGREGFWLHRSLVAERVDNVVVDSASIEVPRRKRRLKTDRVDLEKLAEMLVRYHLGDRRVWRVVHVPSGAAEDARQLHRDLATLRGERTMHSNRIKGLLATQGVRLPVQRDFREQLAAVRLWDGAALPPGLRERLEREYDRWAYLQEQIQAVEAARLQLLAQEQDPVMAKVRQLMRLKGIGVESAWLLVMEFFAWREFQNRREVGSLAGLTGTPSASGESSQDQGISKAGNEWVRVLVIEIAWGWVRFQPDSALSRWFVERYGTANRGSRKTGIVAVARKLLIALWHYLEAGEVPAGAQLKA